MIFPEKVKAGMCRMFTVLAVLFLAAGTACAGAAPLTIAENGATDAIVCVDEEAEIDGDREWERRAAEDLVDYIELMTGARLELVDDPGAVEELLDGDTPALVVGELALRTDAATREALESAAEDDPVLRADAIAVRRDGERVYVAGTNDDSHYYAAAWLLNEWGVRWYLPSEFGEVVPERDALTVDELDHAWAPPFEARQISWRWNAPRDDQPEFTRRNFKNWAGVGAGHRLGSYVEDIVPEGKTHWNVPLSDPETASHVADQVQERYAEGEHIGMGMQDGTYESEYERDEMLRANLYDKYFQTQVLTDPFMVFYNQLAAELMERHPEGDGTIGFLAYTNITIPPQREIYAKEPLIALLAPIDIDPNHGMDDHRSPPRREYREMMYRWAEIMDGRVQIYDYDQGMLVWRDLPNPSHQAFRQDVQHYRDAGVLGFCTESRGSFATVFTNLHIRGQLMWNPDTDVDALLDEFYEKFYGPASAPMAEYWNALFEAWEDTIVTEHEYYVIPAIYTEELVGELQMHLEEGQSAVDGLRERDEDDLSRNERLYLERMDFTEKSFNLIDQYTGMVRAAATRGDYAAAAEAGRQALKTRVELAEMNRNFTTRVVGTASPDDPAEPGGSPAWFRGEVQQYIDLKHKTEGTDGELVKMLPLEWAYRRDPNDTGLSRGFARKSADLTYWEENSEHYAEPEARKDYPTTEWEMIDTDLYAQAQGVLHPDWQSFTGFMWYKTEVELEAAQAEGSVHIHFPGLFSEAWLYVNGYLVEHRPQNHMWWRNDYSFNWEVDLNGNLEEGTNDITVRVHNTHHNGGLFRRPFLYRPAE